MSYLTALRWYHAGKIKNAIQIDTGTILVNENRNFDDKIKKVRICLYGRVSNNNRKQELNYQIDRLINFTNSRGLVIDKIYKEVASGMNDNRKELWKMLNSEPTIIIVEHKDRLTRFGFNYLETLLNKLGCEIIVMNRDDDNEDDLLKDLVSIITSFCCRLYGLRRGKNKANKVKNILK